LDSDPRETRKVRPRSEAKEQPLRMAESWGTEAALPQGHQVGPTVLSLSKRDMF
jgi:hypothetical protein